MYRDVSRDITFASNVWEKIFSTCISTEFIFVPNVWEMCVHLCIERYREILPLLLMCEKNFSTYISREFIFVSNVWEMCVHLCIEMYREILPLLLMCEKNFSTYISREFTLVSNVWDMFLHLSTEMFARWGGFSHQKSDGRDWNVRANMCHVQGILKSDKKNVSWSCHRPYSPTAWEIGSSVSPSLLGLTEECFGAGPLDGVVSVIEAVGTEVNMLSLISIAGLFIWLQMIYVGKKIWIISVLVFLLLFVNRQKITKRRQKQFFYLPLNPKRIQIRKTLAFPMYIMSHIKWKVLVLSVCFGFYFLSVCFGFYFFSVLFRNDTWKYPVIIIVWSLFHFSAHFYYKDRWSYGTVMSICSFLLKSIRTKDTAPWIPCHCKSSHVLISNMVQSVISYYHDNFNKFQAEVTQMPFNVESLHFVWWKIFEKYSTTIATDFVKRETAIWRTRDIYVRLSVMETANEPLELDTWSFVRK
jgi:hypothetical protein